MNNQCESLTLSLKAVENNNNEWVVICNLLKRKTIPKQNKTEITIELNIFRCFHFTPLTNPLQYLISTYLVPTTTPV